jgi:putative ABC transport system substrate-binding protein
MRRRDFITLLSGTAVAWSLGARAQQSAKLPLIGFLGQSAPSSENQRLTAFVQRLRELGWTEGRNIVIEVRWAQARPERAAEFAAEFVRLKADVIVTSGNTASVGDKASNVGCPNCLCGCGRSSWHGLGRESCETWRQHHGSIGLGY